MSVLVWSGTERHKTCGSTEEWRRDMLKIYGRANSINVRKVLWMAEELSLTYEREDWGRGYRPTTDEDYKRINPFEVVPAIDDNGYTLRESNTIVRYLAVRHDRQDLYPAELHQRFRCEAWMDWARQDLYVDVRPIMMARVFKVAEFQDPDIQTKAQNGWTRIMEMLETFLADGTPYLMGDHFTIADIPTGLVVNRWFSIDFPKPNFPHIKAYYERLSDRPPYMAHGRNGMP
jgi:glutathione S-transferase